MGHDITTAARPRMVTPWYLELDPQRRLFQGKTYRIMKRAMDLFLCLLIAPLALAEGAASGRPVARKRACIAGCAGTRMPMVDRPALAIDAIGA